MMIETTRVLQKHCIYMLWHLASSVSRTKEMPENNVMEISSLRNKQQSTLITSDSLILHPSPK